MTHRPVTNPDASPTDTVPEEEHEAHPLALGDEGPSSGLARLVLSLVKLLHDLLEKQAIRRMESGRLTEEQVEKVGRTLKRQSEEIEHLCDVFGLEPGDLSLDLGTVRGVEEARPEFEDE